MVKWRRNLGKDGGAAMKVEERKDNRELFALSESMADRGSPRDKVEKEPGSIMVEFPPELSRFRSIKANGVKYINKNFTFSDSPKKSL